MGDGRLAWESGVVLSVVSTGSYGPELRPLTDASGLLPYGDGVRYDSDPGRCPTATPRMCVPDTATPD